MKIEVQEVREPDPRLKEIAQQLRDKNPVDLFGIVVEASARASSCHEHDYLDRAEQHLRIARMAWDLTIEITEWWKKP